MLHRIFTLVFMLAPICFAQTWQEIFAHKAQILNNPEFAVLKAQYQAYSTKSAPIVAAPVIKSIDIVENNEELIDVRQMGQARIAMLPNPTGHFASPDCNSGLPHASKIRKSVWLCLEKMVRELDTLASEFGYKSGTIDIKVFEGLRDLKTQELLFKNKFDEIKAKNPNMTDELVEAETAKWVSPVKNNVPVHSTGAAVDIRLWNSETKQFIDLGKFGVIWGSNPAGQTFSEELTDAQKLNRLFLLIAAAQAGLINYPYEYWHFSCGDRYAAYWRNQSIGNGQVQLKACYGPAIIRNMQSKL